MKHSAPLSLVLMVLAFLTALPPLWAQQILSGTVRDGKNNETLIGANVVIKGTTQGAQTDFDGKFRFVQVCSSQASNRANVRGRTKVRREKD